MHICPVEISAFLMALPFVGIAYRWFVGCCKACCSVKHEHIPESGKPITFNSRSYQPYKPPKNPIPPSER